MINNIVGVRAVGARARAASRDGSGSDHMMQLPAAPAPQHWLFHAILAC
jgi:hypothetical protein